MRVSSRGTSTAGTGPPTWASYQGGTGGVLRVILHPVDLYLCPHGKEPGVPATTTVDANGNATITASIGLDGNHSVPVKVGWRLKGDSTWQFGVTTPKDGLVPWGRVAYTFPVSGVSDGQVLEVMVNYDKGVPEGRSTDPLDNAYADNTCATTLEGTQPSPSLTLSAPPTFATCTPGDAYSVTVTWMNQNAGAYGPVRRTVVLRTGKSGQRTLSDAPITLAPGVTQEEFQLPALTQGTDVYLVSVTLNPDDPLAQQTTATAVTLSGACDNPPPPPNPGGTLTVIVQDDCIPNPDLTDGRPCLNHDVTIPHWP